jgi:hypothetical protein
MLRPHCYPKAKISGMNTRLFLPLVALAALFFVGCDAQTSLVGKYNIEQDGYGFGPGADKIILDLRSDQTFDVKAGPLVMLDGTWQAKDGTLTFSREQGAIVTSYRVDGAKLAPQSEGKDVTGWRWKRM